MLVIDFILDISQIVLADMVLSGDNALIIGMAAASFAEKDRRKIILTFMITIYRTVLLSFLTLLCSRLLNGDTTGIGKNTRSANF